MKFAIDKYPLGSFKGQQTPGKYCDKTLHDAMNIMARNIVNDMTFLMFVFSSTLEVGTGKSVFVSQLGEMWTELVNKNHKLNLKFDINNCVFKPKDLIEKSFKLPKYSFIWLDEWEDAHYWSQLGMSLRQFFRKCRQLNLCMICIVPNFFQIPLSYATSRSVAAIDVQFKGEFQRGFFAFYSFDRKKQLYILGKKTMNYHVCKPNFIGRFTDGYCVNEKEYRDAKYKDMIESEEEIKPKTDTQIKAELFITFRKNNPDITLRKTSEMFGISDRTAQRWLTGDYAGADKGEMSPHISNLDDDDIIKEIADEPEPFDLENKDEENS